MPTGVGKLRRAAMLDFVFKGATATAPADIFVALHTADPLDDGSAVNEVNNANGYTRVQFTNNTTNWNAGSNPSNDAPAIVTNKIACTFPTAVTAAWASGAAITHFSLRTIVTTGDVASANFIGRGTVTPNTNVINVGNTPSFAAGQMSISITTT